MVITFKKYTYPVTSVFNYEITRTSALIKLNILYTFIRGIFSLFST